MLGQTLGHYRILAQLGAGGMGVVYRARDENLERDVALKVLPAGTFADETARARFRKEALALSQLNHPHICTIYDVGEANGQAYIAMEYVEGRPLSTIVPHDGMPVENVVRYGAQIAAALQHAHDRGVVHRDLKGSNVIVTPDGRAKVLDFGLARRLEESKAGEATRSQGSLTQAGAVMGTLHYMAPEVLRGEPADARSDLWALGVMLYEMASGELPFQGQTGFAISSAILKEPPKPPRRGCPRACGRSSSGAWRRSRASATSGRARSTRRWRRCIRAMRSRRPRNLAPAGSPSPRRSPCWSWRRLPAASMFFASAPRRASSPSPCCRSRTSPATPRKNTSPTA